MTASQTSRGMLEITDIIYIHGYSESSLGAYYDFPTRVSTALKFDNAHVYVSAFDSLDDDVSIGDLADAFESHVVNLETAGVRIATSAIVAHSTGALIARQWMLNRVSRNRSRPDARSKLALPSHFVSMAGANHGSSLAQSGKSLLGYVQKLWTHQILSVGKRVLTDLDYGSEFLLQLNRQWSIEMQSGDGLGALLAFSLGGDIHGHGLGVDLFPPSAEPGSDNTVRISGANLNYTFMAADPEAGTIVALPGRSVPHAILHGYSHYGPETGIWGMKPDPDAAVNRVVDALTSNAQTYADLATRWAADLLAWTTDNTPIADATLVFNVHDRSGEAVEDASVLIIDGNDFDAMTDPAGSAAYNQRLIDNLTRVSKSIVNEPIRNAVNPSSVAFYFNFAEYKNTSPHRYHIEASSASKLVEYRVVDYAGPTGPTDDAHVIKVNQFTYVDVTMDRIAAETYRFYPWPPPSTATTTAWNPPLIPFPPGSIQVTT